MTRKAKREGKPDDYYLKAGQTAPGPQDILTCTGCSGDQAEQRRHWKEHFGQFCFDHYVLGKCQRSANTDENGLSSGKTKGVCTFLHAAAASKAQSDNVAHSWLAEQDE